MTKDEIIEIAESCGWDKGNTWDDCMRCSPFNIESFAKLVAQHEREECAKVCESWQEWGADGELLSKAIRARAKE
jgi:hypothetical protein